MITKDIFKIISMVVLLFLMVLLTWYFHSVLRTGTVFTHFYYIPIALASIWWKRKGIFVAVFLSGVLSLSCLFIEKYPFATLDCVRSIIFISVSWIIAVLSETVAMEKTAKDHFAEESVTDALTGLRNYSFFKKNADFLFNISIRYDSPFTLVIMDIDHFKHINDTYGHKTGNLVLEHFSKALKSCFRRADILIRYGGDEFMLLLPGINANRINYVMKRLERHIRENPLQLGNTRISYTFKWGASEFKEDIPDINEMFKEADKKLYSSKNRD